MNSTETKLMNFSGEDNSTQAETATELEKIDFTEILRMLAGSLASGKNTSFVVQLREGTDCSNKDLMDGEEICQMLREGFKKMQRNDMHSMDDIFSEFKEKHDISDVQVRILKKDK